MAIAFGRAAQGNSTTNTSPIVVTITINAGETGVIVFAATTNGGGGFGGISSIVGGGTWTLRAGGLTDEIVEIWSTDAGAAIAASSVTINFTGIADEQWVAVAAYTGVLGIGQASNIETADLNMTLTTQDANNFVVAGFALEATSPGTANVGTFRASGGSIRGSFVLMDNTSASPASVVNSITNGAGALNNGVALELRSVVPPAVPKTAAIFGQNRAVSFVTGTTNSIIIRGV